MQAYRCAHELSIFSTMNSFYYDYIPTKKKSDVLDRNILLSSTLLICLPTHTLGSVVMQSKWKDCFLLVKNSNGSNHYSIKKMKDQSREIEKGKMLLVEIFSLALTDIFLSNANFRDIQIK